jgi:tRNA-binding EMAP/Myf-like protein
LTSTDQIIKKVGWAEGSGKLFVLTVDNGDNSNIFIFNIEKAEMENVLSHKNIREFIVKDDLLIFDRGNNKNSEIILYNFENNKTIYTIELPGGCSLSNLSVN